jgi:hypothetical protein
VETIPECDNKEFCPFAQFEKIAKEVSLEETVQTFTIRLLLPWFVHCAGYS